jgi:uncharacterized protein (DUF885 family)
MALQSPAFNAWLDDFLVSYYRYRPVNATFIGVHEHDHRLPDYSERGVDEVISDMKNLLQRLQALPEEKLSEAETLDRMLAEGFLEIQLWEYDSHHFHRGNPCVYTGEAVFGVMSLFLRPFAPFSKRVESAVLRLAAVPVLLEQGKHNLRRAPKEWTRRAIRECSGALNFLREGIELLMKEEGAENDRIRKVADRAEEAFVGFRQFLESELLYKTSSHYFCGEDVLSLLIRRGHFLTEEAADIEKSAVEKIAEYEGQLEARAGDFGSSNWKKALNQLSRARPNVQQYYGRYQEIWDACRHLVEENRLLTWPDFPIRYVPQPTWTRKAAPYLYFLFYRSPSPFDNIPVVDYLVTPVEMDMPSEEQERLLRSTNDSVIKLNHVVHHGGPGHHVQNWHARRTTSRIGQIAAVDCATRVAMFCGGTMAEGWACYATDLMEEYGFLTPLERYAEYHARLRMAGRALVDVRLHRGQITLEEAASFYQERIGMSREAALSETVKNSMFPGTALMYLVGTELIHGLRRELVGETYSGVSLCDFHDRFLSYGSVPVPLIANALRNRAGIRGE